MSQSYFQIEEKRQKEDGNQESIHQQGTGLVNFRSWESQVWALGNLQGPGDTVSSGGMKRTKISQTKEKQIMENFIIISLLLHYTISAHIPIPFLSS